MNAKSLDVFALRDRIIDEYRNFATSFTKIQADDIRRQIDDIYSQGRFWPEPLVQVNPSYKRGASLRSLIAAGALDPLTAEIFQADGVPLGLYKHQEQAIALASAGESYVVTTGTGSGKSLCFFVPIVSAVLAEKRASAAKRTRAIIIYPMNALANSQLDELEKFVGNVAGEKPVTYARYTGQESTEERRKIAENPPDILLTNFMMLELLMTRQDELDRSVMDHCVGLRFLVLDELHTYRGRQGADVALLVRRVRERLAPEGLQCIGTSATMASEGSNLNKQEVVAGVASKLFAQLVDPSNVIVEELERVTDDALLAESVQGALGAAIDAGISPAITDAALRRHPLAIWTETRLGITTTAANPAWHRARPRTLDEAARELAADAGRDEAACREALRRLLLVSGLPERERTGDSGGSSRSFFVFKLHQFVSGAGHAFATLEPAGQRTLTVEGQVFLPGDSSKRLFPVHFCRECGHEYHPVRFLIEEGERVFRARDIDDAPPPKAEGEPEFDGDEAELFGFLTLDARDEGFNFEDKDEFYPETWLTVDAGGNARIKSHFRSSRARPCLVRPDGREGSGARAFFIPGRFRFCLRCGATHSTAARDRTRLASLSAEGRSSATTVLAASALLWMHGPGSGLPVHTRKLLGFTDNRQDAALQSGHFNDFLFVGLIRSAFLGALDLAGEQGLRSDQLGAAQQRALGFDRSAPELRAEWLLDPGLQGFHLTEAESTLRQVLAYRVFFDQRRGWRYTNPNLEQLELVEVHYLGLDELAAGEELFAAAPALLRLASPAVRKALYLEIFDHLRKWLAIRSQVLESTAVEQMLQRSHSRLRLPWGFGSDEKLRTARWLFVKAPVRKDKSLRDESLIVRGGSRSVLGKILRSSRSPSGRPLWPQSAEVRALKPAELDAMIEELLRAACAFGLVSEEITPFGDQKGFRLNDACMVFKRRSPGIGGAGKISKENKFFGDFYGNLAAILREPVHPLFGFEAREHTAQVDDEKRRVREKRFRFGSKERQELSEDPKHLVDIGETSRFLPLLFCSPTMELGVDISALNAVYLRNVPPTPANYAQRSGRAGRSGQAALVLTYSSSQSPHDQYFFRDPRAMVYGEVRPPLLDLANRDLVESHLCAVWLACTELPLDPSIAELLVLPEPDRPLKSTVTEPMALPAVAAEARRRILRILDLLERDLTPELAPWYRGREALATEIVDRALVRFGQTFQRWRDLFAAAEQQRDHSRRAMDDYAAPQADKRAAQGRHAQAIDQLNLLQADTRGSNSPSSDFNTYRYLATEGFLPGYNFPRLPLMAYIPATSDGRGRQTYLQRPRFLALSEFGPRSLVYHEGRAFRVARAMLALGTSPGVSPDARLATQKARICRRCGGGHWDDEVSMCHACQAPLDGVEVVGDIFRIENVSTLPAERITANDEERQRQGFELQTTFQWAIRDQRPDVRAGSAVDGEGVAARLFYGPGATITRLNKGLRRRKDRTQLGFWIDPVSGFWAKNEDEADAGADPHAASRQRIVPSVQDRKNALLLQPADPELSQTTLTTVQHALVRGIEAVFQLEEGEILAEPLPSRDRRTGFLCYEATEGGAGVLTRLVAESDRLAEVARAALAILHFDLSGGLPAHAADLADAAGSTCVAACYRCLMSYYNQPDHESLDRRDDDARRILLRLAHSAPRLESSPARAPAPPPPVAAGLEAAWLACARERELPPPDAEPLAVAGQVVPLIWRRHYVAALFEASGPLAADLENRGFEIVRLGSDPADWDEPAALLARFLGRP